MPFNITTASHLRNGTAAWFRQEGHWTEDAEAVALFSVQRDLTVPGGGSERSKGPLPSPPSATSHSPYAGIYRYDEYERQFLRDRAARFRRQVERRLSGELTEDEFKPLRLMNGLHLQLHGYMLRVALPYGVLSAAQMRQLAYVARHFGRGYGHFTTRQNIQFNWPRLEDTPDILAILAEADLHAIQTSGNCVRNVTTDQFAGATVDEVVDPRLYAEILRQWSTDHPEFTYLPRKFEIAITGSSHDRAAIRVQDIGILAKRDTKGEVGFQIYVGGGLGRTLVVGTKVRDWLPRCDLLRYLEAVLRVYHALGRRDRIDDEAGLEILLRDMQPETVIRMIEDEFSTMPADYCVLEQATIDAVAARFQPTPFETLLYFSKAFSAALNEDGAFRAWVHSNTHLHHKPGYLAATISLKPAGGIPGEVSAEDMEAVAAIAEQFSFGEIRVSHEQNLVLPHVRKDDAYAVWKALGEAGLATANIGLITDVILCPGLDSGSVTTARAILVAQRISQHFANPERQREIGPLDLNISGCITACGYHHVGHIGLLGVDRNGEEFYQITLGGAANEKAAIGTIIGPAVGVNEVVGAIDAIVNAYLAHRQDGEPFIETYRRLGQAPFKEAVYGGY
ncbi:MAG TPA: nitrite/sulfite reductase [Rhodopila sp.]|jgi:sulfite reductase (NADPH) hemoprotein beta-component|nr:nitrite/sulfite reductase [Rhodopila sp.]